MCFDPWSWRRLTGGKLWLSVLLAGGLAWQTRCAALDFTLHTVKVTEDGFTHDESYFVRDSGANVGIRIPPTWVGTSTPGSLALSSPTIGSSVRLEVSPLTPAAVFKDKDLETYRKLVVADVPPGATDIRLGAEQVNPLPIFHWTDHEFSVQYALYGQLYKRSVLFVNLEGGQQIRLTSAALATDFDRTHEAGFSLLQSWQETPAAPAR